MNAPALPARIEDLRLVSGQGRFAAVVEPKSVQLQQNRVDIVSEINEGPKSKVRQINIIGNEKFSDGDLQRNGDQAGPPAALHELCHQL